jgi:uncharacterized SAM-binding protein YcdF (DUF218 family)
MNWPGGFHLAKAAAYLISPLTVSIGLMLAALVFAQRKRYRWAVRFAVVGVATLWLAATPLVSLSLGESLASGYPLVAPAQSPRADAIVVLGGTVTGARPPQRPVFGMGPGSDRVWHAAALYRAGKAPLVLVAAGNQPHLQDQQVEADAIFEALVTLGCPPAPSTWSGPAATPGKTPGTCGRCWRRSRCAACCSSPRPTTWPGR